MERPELNKLLQAAKRREFDVVVVKDLSRFGRNTLHLQQNLEMLKENNIKFVAIDNGLDGASSPIGELMITILAGISQFERDTILARTSEGREVKRQAHKSFMGWTPFGYRWNKLTEKVEVYEKEEDGTYTKEAETYLHIVSRYLDFGISIVNIARELNDNHTPARRKDSRWSASVIAGILSNPVYKSTLLHHEKVTEPYPIEPLITTERWEDIQKRTYDAKLRSGKPGRAAKEFLLYKLLKCGLCGARLSAQYYPVRDDRTQHRVYICYLHRINEKRLEPHQEKCALPPIPAQEIEDYVWKRLKGFMDSNVTEAKLSNTAHWEAEERRLANKIKGAEQEKGKSEVAKERLLDMLRIPGAFSEAEFLSRKHQFETEISQYGLEAEEARAELVRKKQMREEEQKMFQFATDKADLLRQVSRIIDILPLFEKQRLVKGMVLTPLVVTGFDYEWLETGEPDPGKLKYVNWKDSLIVIMHFNWPLLREILDKYLPGGSGGPGGPGWLNSELGYDLDYRLSVEQV